MGIFDKLFKVNTARARELELTSEEAFFGIALSSVAADEVVSQEELNVVGFTISRMPAFRKIHPNQMVQMINKFLQIIKREGVGTIINAAKNRLSEEMKETAFALAVDIVLADGVVDRKETEFLEQLQAAIEISDELVTKIVEVLQIKNRGIIQAFDPTKSKFFYG